MPETKPCPHCGAPIRVDSGPIGEDRRSPSAPKGAEIARDPDLPPVPLLAPGSHDDDFIGSAIGGNAAPDPFLGKFISPSSSSAVAKVRERRPGSSAGDVFPAIDLGSKIGPARVADREAGGEVEEDEVGPSQGRRTSWKSVLLASYASAITLGLAWTLMRGRPRDSSVVEVPPPRPAATASPESARQAGLSRKVEPPEPILGEHFAKLGRPLQVGDLEVTPVDVKRQDVTLQRSATYAKAERKSGGKGALILRLKLRNTSKDSVFAPLDQAYVRERGKGVVDTFVLTVSEERIYPFPLALESEWSIIGQDFNELRPGESKTVAIVSAPETPPDSAGPFTWRVRLRTGIDRTDVIGIRWPDPGASGPARVDQ